MRKYLHKNSTLKSSGVAKINKNFAFLYSFRISLPFLCFCSQLKFVYIISSLDSKHWLACKIVLCRSQVNFLFFWIALNWVCPASLFPHGFFLKVENATLSTLNKYLLAKFISTYVQYCQGPNFILYDNFQLLWLAQNWVCFACLFPQGFFLKVKNTTLST